MVLLKKKIRTSSDNSKGWTLSQHLIVASQWTRFRWFAIESTSEFHTEQPSIIKAQSPCREWHRFDMNNWTSIRLSKSMKKWWVFHMLFPMLLLCPVGGTSKLAAWCNRQLGFVNIQHNFEIKFLHLSYSGCPNSILQQYKHLWRKINDIF